VCSRVNRYWAGVWISLIVFFIHVGTMLTDALMRCTKKKGVIRSLVKFFTVGLKSKFKLRYIDCQLQDPGYPNDLDIYPSVGLCGPTLRL
jgi:hypothetical protein